MGASIAVYPAKLAAMTGHDGSTSAKTNPSHSTTSPVRTSIGREEARRIIDEGVKFSVLPTGFDPGRESLQQARIVVMFGKGAEEPQDGVGNSPLEFWRSASSRSAILFRSRARPERTVFPQG